MPKRPSLVGTAREAMGDSRKVQEHASDALTKHASKKHRRGAVKSKQAPAPEAPAVAATPERVAPEPDHKPVSSSSSAYEAMLAFANAALKQNIETGVRLAQCKSPLEVLAAQTAHAAALTQSFIAASLKLMQASSPGAPWTLWKPRGGSQ